MTDSVNDECAYVVTDGSITGKLATKAEFTRFKLYSLLNTQALALHCFCLRAPKI